MDLSEVEVEHHDPPVATSIIEQLNQKTRVVASWYDAADGKIHVQYG